MAPPPRITMISKLPQSQASTVGGRRTFYRDRTRETLEICHMRCFCLIIPQQWAFPSGIYKNRPVTNRAVTYMRRCAHCISTTWIGVPIEADCSTVVMPKALATCCAVARSASFW